MTMLTRILRLTEKKKDAGKPAEPPAKVKITRSSEFNADLKKHSGTIGAKMADFIKMKMDDPMAQFGGTDRHFTAGPLAGTGIIHAHLNHNLQVLYRRSGKNPTKIELLRLGSHDDFGTGQPSNQKIMKNVARQIDGMVTEAKGHVLNDMFAKLNKQMKASRQENSRVKFTKEDERHLRALKRVKDQDVWTGGNRPTHGPALSSKVSATREIVLQRRTSDGKICVSQRSDTANDAALRTFANNAQGYEKALAYYMSLL